MTAGRKISPAESLKAMLSISNRLPLLTIAGLLVASGFGDLVWAQRPSAPTPAERLLAEAIAYHDTASRWGRGAYRLTLEESRPDGTERTTAIGLDFRRGAFSWTSERGGRRVEGELVGPDCSLRLDGSSDYAVEEAEALGLTCERLRRLRDYYTYLWGLPMKLRDPGTRIDPEVERTTFLDRPVRRLAVTYDEAVGGDTWYFYFDVEQAVLVGYRFYHDPAANDGEYITLEGLLERGGFRLPRRRTWYTNDGDELLGTDTLIAIEVLAP